MARRRRQKTIAEEVRDALYESAETLLVELVGSALQEMKRRYRRGRPACIAAAKYEEPQEFAEAQLQSELDRIAELKAKLN